MSKAYAIRPKQITTKPDHGTVEVGGWLQGHLTYLWLGHGGACIGTISGAKLYRLAKAIVRHYEAEKP